MIMANPLALKKVARHTFLLVMLLTAGFSVLAQTAAKPQASPAQTKDAGVGVSEKLVDSSLDDDPAVTKMVAVYSPKVRKLDVVLGRLTGELKKGGAGSGSLGNFVTDGMRWQATLKTGKTITLAVMNGGGLRRSTIGEGELRARDVFELLPFENALVTVDLTGVQLKKLLDAILIGNEAQSGGRIVYKTTAEKKNEAESIKLREAAGETEIDPAKIYTVVTIDYLYNVGGARWGILREGANMKPLGITLRDSLMNYVKSETAAGREIKPNLDGRFSLDKANSAPEVKP
jgi:2',3'-cyclic-nucleotide 2'-phosphodiesterase (5'-nucleotidase family)